MNRYEQYELERKAERGRREQEINARINSGGCGFIGGYALAICVMVAMGSFSPYRLTLHEDPQKKHPPIMWMHQTGSDRLMVNSQENTFLPACQYIENKIHGSKIEKIIEYNKLKEIAGWDGKRYSLIGCGFKDD